MAFTLSDIERIERGALVQIGALDREIAHAMGAHSMNVSLSTYSLNHIRSEHPDITDWQILMLPTIISHGLIVKEVRKPNHLVFSYFVAEPNIRLHATMKIVVGSFENYVVTLHRANKRQVRALLKRGELIRKHK